MSLPVAKHKKLIKEKEFVEVAKKVSESFEQEKEYLYEKKLKHGHHLPSRTYTFS